MWRLVWNLCKDNCTHHMSSFPRPRSLRTDSRNTSEWVGWCMASWRCGDCIIYSRGQDYFGCSETCGRKIFSERIKDIRTPTQCAHTLTCYLVEHKGAYHLTLFPSKYVYPCTRRRYLICGSHDSLTSFCSWLFFSDLGPLCRGRPFPSSCRWSFYL